MKPNLHINKKPYAIVFTLDSINGLQTARTLAARGVPVIGVARDHAHPCCKTNVCEEIIIADTQSEEVIEALEVLGARLLEKSVLFPCNNMEVLLVSRHRRKLENFYHIILPEPDVVEVLLNKDNFYNYAHREGLPIPRTSILNNRQDAERAANKLVFPCIVKPPIKDTEWERNNPFKAYKVFNANDFLDLYERCIKWCRELIVQEWIEGPDSNLYTCYSYFSADFKPLVTFVTRKLRQWPPEVGEGCLGEECRNDIVLEQTIRLFTNVCLRGFGYLEMKCDSRTGKYFIVEPNIGRPTSKSALAELGGVELVYTMYCDALGWTLPENREQKYGNAKWIFLRRDFSSAFYYWRGRELTLAEWWRSLKGVKLDAMFSRADPIPFWYDLLISFWRYMSPREHRKKNYRDPFPKKIQH